MTRDVLKAIWSRKTAGKKRGTEHPKPIADSAQPFAAKKKSSREQTKSLNLDNNGFFDYSCIITL